MAISLSTGGKKRPKAPGTKARRRRKGPWWSRVLLWAFVFYVGYTSLGQVRLMVELRRELAQVEQAILAGRQKSEEISAEIVYLNSDSYVEKAAREELGLVQPGEMVFMTQNIDQPLEDN